MGNIIIWLVIGFGAGLFVNLFFENYKKYFTGTILAGIVGAFVGGVVYSALRIGTVAKNIDIASFLTAFLGAGVLLLFINILLKSENASGEHA
jgi:uncharacterized membrane protein YeaQ/YmgE (transglycosylase-associated protein family)